MPRTGCRSPLSWFAGPLLVSSLAAQQFSTADRQLAVAKIWAGARTNYAYNDRVRADWDSALTATLALATARQSDFQLYHRLRRMIALLNDGTAAIVPAAALRGRIARPPLELVSFEDRVFIADYAPNDEMRIARPERLAEIVAVQGIPTGTWIRDSVLPDIGGATPEARWHRAVAQMLEGEKGTAVHLQLRSPHPSADERGASVTRTISLDERWPFTRPALEVDTLPGGIAWVRLNSLADPNAPAVFDRTFPDFTKVTGVILDLRENTGAGGGRDDGYRILSRLMNRAFVTSRWRTALYRPALQGIDMPDSAGAWVVGVPDTIRPRQDRPAFTGPVAVLTSPRTAGVAEDLLVAFRSAGRGSIIGETSAGSSGQVFSVSLPHGWAFLVCVSREAFPDGTEFAGIGVMPEVPVTVTVEDFLAGRDAVLDRAQEWMRERMAANPRR